MNEQEFNFIKDWIQKPASIGDLRLVLLISKTSMRTVLYHSNEDVALMLSYVDKDIEHVIRELRNSK